ncbi:hypothetical protein MW887_007711 [Aspergillus wentii]|nr:hypothetical protein MW887_007711 [Aspergillus wentii]
MWGFPLWSLVGPLLFLYCLLPSGEIALDVPTVKYSRFLPKFANRLLYYLVAPSLIKYGYGKYKNQPFRLLKADGDLIVLPIEYVDELRNLPPSKLSSLDAQYENVLGEYTNVLIESALPPDTAQRRLTPALGRITPRILDELKYSFETDFPECKDNWVSVNPFNLVLSLINRAASRVIIGEELCRNEEWLNISANYTINVGITVMMLRPIPSFLRPLVARYLPSAKKLQRQLRFVKDELFVPLINTRRNQEARNPSYKKPDDFLQWMMDLADNSRDKEPEFLAQNLLIFISLAAVHTSTMFMTHVLFDLMARPGYLEPLRNEIQTSLKSGWENGTHLEFLQMRLFDSFLKESQRFNPSSERPLCHDPNVVPEPYPFDGLRWAEDSSKGVSTNLVTINSTNMHFGFGRQACPGRFFAANTIKAIMSRLIFEYDFKFQDGMTDRPINIRNGEQTMPNMYTEVFMKKRDIKL